MKVSNHRPSNGIVVSVTGSEIKEKEEMQILFCGASLDVRMRGGELMLVRSVQSDT